MIVPFTILHFTCRISPPRPSKKWHARHPIKCLQFASSRDVSSASTCANQRETACLVSPMSSFQRAAFGPMMRLHDGKPVKVYRQRRSMRLTSHCENIRETLWDRRNRRNRHLASALHFVYLLLQVLGKNYMSFMSYDW